MKFTQITESHRTVHDGNIFYTDDEGKFHREDDLPAIEWKDGSKEYWNHGERYTPDWVKKAPIVKKTPYHGGHKVEITHPDGTVEHAHEYSGGLAIEYYDEKGERHRDNDQPAFVDRTTKYWYKHGLQHRDGDKPAVVYDDGVRQYYHWYQNGKLHRDGDLPAAIESNGSQIWWKNGKIHRDRGKPAIINADGSKEYWVNDQLIKYQARKNI